MSKVMNVLMKIFGFAKGNGTSKALASYSDGTSGKHPIVTMLQDLVPVVDRDDDEDDDDDMSLAA
jgi:hypothetical protein